MVKETAQSIAAKFYDIMMADEVHITHVSSNALQSPVKFNITGCDEIETAHTIIGPVTHFEVSSEQQTPEGTIWTRFKVTVEVSEEGIYKR